MLFGVLLVAFFAVTTAFYFLVATTVASTPLVIALTLSSAMLGASAIGTIIYWRDSGWGNP